MVLRTHFAAAEHLLALLVHVSWRSEVHRRHRPRRRRRRRALRPRLQAVGRELRPCGGRRRSGGGRPAIDVVRLEMGGAPEAAAEAPEAADVAVPAEGGRFERSGCCC